ARARGACGTARPRALRAYGLVGHRAVRRSVRSRHARGARSTRMTKRWLFSAPIDLAVFGGTAVVALALVTLLPFREAPEWSWIAHLRRGFAWMKDGDFVAGVPAAAATVAFVAWVALLAIYVVRAVAQRNTNWGKHLVVATTVACWYVGIVATNSDFGFTVTNVFVHGIPYMVLVFVYARSAAHEASSRDGAAAHMLAGR